LADYFSEEIPRLTLGPLSMIDLVMVVEAGQQRLGGDSQASTVAAGRTARIERYTDTKPLVWMRLPTTRRSRR
jgi:hypothetical protein